MRSKVFGVCDGFYVAWPHVNLLLQVGKILTSDFLMEERWWKTTFPIWELVWVAIEKGSNLIPSATLQLLLSTAAYQFLISIWFPAGGDGSLADFLFGVVAEDYSHDEFFEVRRRSQGPVKAVGLNPDSKSLWVPNGVHWTVWTTYNSFLSE